MRARTMAVATAAAVCMGAPVLSFSASAAQFG